MRCFHCLFCNIEWLLISEFFCFVFLSTIFSKKKIQPLIIVSILWWEVNFFKNSSLRKVFFFTFYFCIDIHLLVSHENLRNCLFCINLKELFWLLSLHLIDSKHSCGFSSTMNIFRKLSNSKKNKWYYLGTWWRIIHCTRIVRLIFKI